MSASWSKGKGIIHSAVWIYNGVRHLHSVKSPNACISSSRVKRLLTLTLTLSQNWRGWKDPCMTSLPSSDICLPGGGGKQGNGGPSPLLHGVGEPYRGGSKGIQPKRSFSYPIPTTFSSLSRNSHPDGCSFGWFPRRKERLRGLQGIFSSGPGTEFGRWWLLHLLCSLG